MTYVKCVYVYMYLFFCAEVAKSLASSYAPSDAELRGQARNVLLGHHKGVQLLSLSVCFCCGSATKNK